MKFTELPKQIQEHYVGKQNEIVSIRAIIPQNGPFVGYNIIFPFSADRWRFEGMPGSRK